VLRILRLFRFLKELTLLAQGIIGAIHALGWSLFLIWLVLYVSAVLTTTLYGHSNRPDILRWFGSLGKSLLTLFQLMTLEDWPQVVRGVIAVPQWKHSWLFFIPFIALTNFVLLNVITGVVVERVLATSEHESAVELNKAGVQRLNMMRQLRELFIAMTTEYNETAITKDEFIGGLEDPEVVVQFYDLGVVRYELEHLFYVLTGRRRSGAYLRSCRGLPSDQWAGCLKGSFKSAVRRLKARPADKAALEELDAAGEVGPAPP